MAVTAVGVTGDVGAGKSTVARLMEALGGLRFDADVSNGNECSDETNGRAVVG